MKTLLNERAPEILVLSLSNIGDVVLTTPVVSRLRQTYPKAKLSMLVGPKAAALIVGSPAVDELIVYNNKAKWHQKLLFLIRLRRRRYDLIVNLRHSAIPWFLRGKRRTTMRRTPFHGTMREHHLSIVEPFVKDERQECVFPFFSHEDTRRLTRKLRGRVLSPDSKLAVFAPGSRNPLKQWPVENFARVAEHLLGRGFHIMLLGAACERACGVEIAKMTGGRAVNVTGELTLRESAALISLAHLVVSNDSAIMHLAHEMDRPTVSIFGPTDECKYGRAGKRFRSVRLRLDCAPCEAAHCQIHRRMCLDDLVPEDVISACEEILDDKVHQTA